MAGASSSASAHAPAGRDAAAGSWCPELVVATCIVTPLFERHLDDRSLPALADEILALRRALGPPAVR
jgi:hypothetical protein